MKVSTRGEYALRALLFLGSSPKQVHTLSEISQATLVPVNYLEQILLQLKNMGYVQSKRGAYGGYYLQKEPKEIVIGEVIRHLEGPLAPMSCVSAMAYEPCVLEPQCLLKPLWEMIRDTVAQLLDQTTLENLLNGSLAKLPPK